jgi:hypothetical protein
MKQGIYQLYMAYQNINQYNFRRWGLKPANEITDICLASDEKDYDQEVVFSPLLIAELDGNRMPFKFNFDSSGTTLCTTSACTFDYDTIVSENYWNPTDIDPNLCPIITDLCDVGLTGIDNGLVKHMSGETIQINTGLYTTQSDKFSRYKYDRRMKMHPITGFTTTENRLWDDNSYTYDLSYNNVGGDIGYVAKLNGGFFQGFYKIPGYDYQVFPQRPNLGWSAEFMLRYRWTGDTSVGLNSRYPNNKGTFFYMGARAENKFYHYPDGSPVQDSGYTRVTSGLTCMDTCACSLLGSNPHDCLKVYQQSGGTSYNCSCGCPCNCAITAQYPETDPLYDGVSNALSLRLSGDTGSPKLCVKTYRITGGCETTGTCLTGVTYTTGTSVTEWCSTRGIFDDCSGTTYSNVEHWAQIDAVFQRNEWFDTCDLNNKGGLGLIVKDIYTATTANNSISLIEPPITHEPDYDPATTEIVTFNDNWTAEEKYRLGTMKFYVNGKLFLVAENFEEIIPRLLNTPKEKQIGVGYNISLGGGTQGLHDNLTFSGGCPPTINDIVYQQDPECLTTHDLDNTIYSGLTTHIKLEEYFGGSMIGDISAFRMYTEPLNASQIKHNFNLLKLKYNLLNPDCKDCRIVIPVNDLYYIEIPEGNLTYEFIPDNDLTYSFIPDNNLSYIFIPDNDLYYLSIPSNDLYYEIINPTPTPTPTPTNTGTPTPTNTETPTTTPTTTQTQTPTTTPTPTNTETPTQTPTTTQTSTPTNTPTPTNTETPTNTPTPTPTGEVIVNAILIGGDEYLSVGNNEYLEFVNPTPSATPISTQTPTPTNTPTPTITETPTNTPTPTVTPTNTSTPTNTPTVTPTPNIVTSGLIMQLDANKTASYPGSGTTIFDLTGSFNNTLSGGATFTTLNGIKCFDCTTNTESIQVSGTGPSLPNTGYTYVTWARIIPSSVGWRSLLRTNNNLPILVREGTDDLGYYNTVFRDSGYNVTSVEEVWVQYAVVGDNASSIFYINGVEVGSVAFGAGGDTHVMWGNNLLAGQPFGYLANLYFYNRKLSFSEINQMYDFLSPNFVEPTPTPTTTSTPTVTPTNTITTTPTPTSTPNAPVTSNLRLYYDPSDSSSYSGTGTTINDLSGNGLNGTMSNITFTSPYFTYNGSSSQVSVADNALLEPGSGDWTIEFWVNHSVIAGASRILIAKTDGGNSADWGYGLRTISNGNTFMEIGNGSTSITTPTSTLSINTWYQVVGVWTNVASNSLALYINGSLIGNNSHSFTSIKNTTSPLYLGSFNGGQFAQWMNGRMGVVRMYNKALTGSEVLQNFNADKSKYGL